MSVKIDEAGLSRAAKAIAIEANKDDLPPGGWPEYHRICAEVAIRAYLAHVQGSPDLAALREVETAWLADALGRCTANLGYPVGCGVAPHPDNLANAAGLLFDRYLTMVGMAHQAAEAKVTGLREALTEIRHKVHAYNRAGVLKETLRYEIRDLCDAALQTGSKNDG